MDLSDFVDLLYAPGEQKAVTHPHQPICIDYVLDQIITHEAVGPRTRPFLGTLYRRTCTDLIKASGRVVVSPIPCAYPRELDGGSKIFRMVRPFPGG